MYAGKKMTSPLHQMFLQNRAPILSSQRTLRFACPRHQTTYFKTTEIRYRAQSNDRFGLIQPGLTTGDSRSALSGAEQLLEEQMRLLEMEREDSLSIARQCSARSKRLIARLDNLKEYRSRAAARRGFTGATQAPNGRGASPRRKSFRFDQDVGAEGKTREETDAAAGTQFRGFSYPPEQQLTSSRDRMKVAACAIGDEGQPVSGPAGDLEEGQARRLVSQALRRNISRGENNLALAEKLQQYLGLLRNELARVRQGDVLLATKILDAHRARTTAATSAATGAAVAVAVAPAPVHSSAAELPLPSPPPPREEQRSVGSLFSGQVPGPPTVVSGMLPAPPGDVAKVNRKPSSGGRGGHVEAVTCTATSAVHGAAGDSGLRGPGSPAFTPAAIALSAHHVGNAVAADAASSTSGSSISTSSPTSSPTSSLTANASSSREESIQGTTVQDQAEWEGEVCNGINGKMSDHGNIVSINRGGGSHVCSGGGGGGGGSDCGPDAASGLSRLFSRTRVLELPGDDTAVATGPQHFAPPQPSASTPLTSPLTTRSASLSSTADVDPPLFVAIAGYDTVCDADTPTAAAGRGIGPPGPDEPTLSSPAFPTSSSSPPGAAAAAIVQGHDGGDSGGDGDGDGRPTAAGVSGPSSETTAAGSSCGGDLGSGTAAASGTQRLGLDAVRRLSDDSESARSTLMGLLSPAGAIPGPLQLAAAATAGSEAVSGYGSSPGYADSKWRGGGGGEHSGGREARAHSGRGGGNDDTQGNARAVVGGCSGSHPRTGTERIHPDELAAPTEPVPPSTSPTSPTSLSSSSEGLYALAGERVPSRRMRIQAPSASAAATKAAVAAAAADAAAAAADCVIGQGPPHASDRAGGEPATTGRELRALMVLLASMVSELRRRGYVGCEEQMDLAAAQLEQLLALSRGEVAAAAAAAAATARGRRSSPR